MPASFQYCEGGLFTNFMCTVKVLIVFGDYFFMLYSDIQCYFYQFELDSASLGKVLKCLRYVRTASYDYKSGICLCIS